MASSTPTISRKTHVVPTHIRAPETLITLAGVSLSVRQFLLILVGVSLSYRLWLALSVLTSLPADQILRWGLAALPCCGALAFAFITLAARSLDAWCVIAMRYLLRPRRFVWQLVRVHEPGFLGEIPQEEDDVPASS